MFVAANGARDAGHEATVGLIADGVLVMKDAIAESAIPVGFPSIKELINTAVGKGVAIHF